MMNVQAEVVDAIEQLPGQIDTILNHLGEGLTSSVPYDTAWLALLSHKYPTQGFNNAYSWLIAHQHKDGSWGGDVEHYHDRVVCTLAAVVALKAHPISRNAEQPIEQAIRYLDRAMQHTLKDANDTVNFPGLSAYLLSQARNLGLDIASPAHKNGSAKLARLRERPELWVNHSIAHSLECFDPTLANAESLIEPNGSLAASPAATAALLLNSDSSHPGAISYLQRYTDADGGVPDVVPIDLFEISWSLNHLRQANAISPSHPQVRRSLDYSWRYWTDKGQSPSSALPVSDLDDAASAFTILDWAGYPVEPHVFASYERDDHFLCFPDETDPSLAANVRLLLAIKGKPEFQNTRLWIAKIVAFVHKQHQWTDKWHVSQLYIRSSAVEAFDAIDRDLALTNLKFILENQRSDGSWGHYNISTAEETAYALQALLYWHCNVSKLDLAPIHEAVLYLANHMDDPYTPLWIGKCLYNPPNVVRAAILAALYRYSTL